MDKPSVLLIGGAGFLGSALAPLLLQNGYDVDLLIRQARGRFDPRVTVYTGGLGNSELLRRILPRYSTVVHLASGTTPGISAQNPSLEAELNIFPTLRLIETLHAFPDIKLVYLSSGGTVYGNPALDYVDEEAAVAPLSYYGAGKAAIEIFLQTFSRTFKSRTVILRPSNLYGPGQPYHRGFGLIRTILQHLHDEKTMEIWGDGEIVRDFIYIDDLANACLEVIKAPHSEGVYNVGYGKGYSISQLCSIVEQVCNRKLHTTRLPERAIDVRKIVLDHSRLGVQFGWRPKTPIESGIQNTWHWLNENRIN
ncbi:MAG: NAD-dependent epimerase/dehydratase family protein [Acidiferrobacterales bacterium]